MAARKRRYALPHYHPAFGYLTSIEVIKEPKTVTVDVGSLVVFGRVDAKHDVEVTALPIVWDEAEAREYYAERKPFAFVCSSRVSMDTRRCEIGFQSEYKEQPPDAPAPAFHIVCDAMPYFQAKGL